MFKFKITPDRHNAIQNLNNYVLPDPPLFCYHLPFMKWTDLLIKLMSRFVVIQGGCLRNSFTSLC
jgi:hypothetical protein